MEINSINGLWLFAFVGLVFVGVLSIVIHYISQNKRLKIKYPLLTKSQRRFMYHTVEKSDEIILDSLRKKYNDQEGVVCREIKVVQRSPDSLVVHIYYKIPICSQRLTVVFDCSKPNSFIYDDKPYNINLVETSNIPLILL